MRTIYVLTEFVMIQTDDDEPHIESQNVGVTTDRNVADLHCSETNHSFQAFELPENEVVPITELANAVKEFATVTARLARS